MIHTGDCLEVMRGMADASVHCCVTSPPYWGLRDYGHDGQLGLEKTPDEYVAKMVEVFREVWRVLRDDGTLWLNLGDSYYSRTRGGGGPSKKQISNAGSRFNAGSLALKPKDLVGIPWRVALALQADGWYLRQDIIWHKPNPMPESVTDRCTKAHEYIFLLSKSRRYYFDAKAIAEPSVTQVQERKRVNGVSAEAQGKRVGQGNITANRGARHTRNKRSVWTVTPKPFKGAHFAVFPPDLIEPCILAGCPESGTVLDPFTGSGTTGAVAVKHGRRFVGCELNPEYVAIAERRIAEAEGKVGLFA
jgi:DNA modification methylase